MAIVLGVLVVLLLSTFMIYLWRKAQVKRCELCALFLIKFCIYL